MAESLGRLITDLGERSLYDSVAQCSRCGYCEQACPTYVATGDESRSPRGRNQIVRLMIEGKLDDPKAAMEALSTCLTCGACTTACYAKVPVVDIVLEGRRMLRGETHWLVKAACRIMVTGPRLFAVLLKIGFLFKKSGLSALGRPALRAAGLSVLASMDEHTAESPFWNLDDLTHKREDPESPAYRYFAPCGPRYLFPRVGQATMSALDALMGQGAYLDNPCCGLLAHNYGELEDARALAKKNIEHAEKRQDAAPIIGDCSSCVAFLKSYPQLFLRPEDAPWRTRAEAFSKRVRDAIEVYGECADKLPAAVAEGVETTYHDSCRAINPQGIKTQPRLAAKKAAGASYCEMAGADACCGGAGAFAFVHEELSEELLKKKIGNAAAVQAGLVLTSSTSCLIQLARGLRKYYPDARVLHLSEFVAGALEKKHGA
ncbi:MAG: (Fe-S)-binding protein [Elusimicrobia bacterium]|nr:(Fe-S)-binding protein [Elusimicrobiota bacterium]